MSFNIGKIGPGNEMPRNIQMPSDDVSVANQNFVIPIETKSFPIQRTSPVLSQLAIQNILEANLTIPTNEIKPHVYTLGYNSETERAIGFLESTAQFHAHPPIRG